MTPDILTAAGRYFNFAEPGECEIDVEEIAHALSHVCRFAGHTRVFYSVAQHSVHVSHLVPPEHALAGLLHDAAEAFVGDVVSPLKQLLPDYKAIERRVEAAVLRRFKLSPQLPDCVKKADLVMLATEQRDLMPRHDEWEIIRGITRLLRPIEPWSPELAKAKFIERFEEIQRTPQALEG